MEQPRISDLTPALPARESKQFRASVILIWPYSSSQRQFALLLADPDFRLRRRNGQVRARFTGSSAKAIATTGVGIGDEVLLSLRGAQFLKEGAVQTPGRSIDWELEYSQTVLVQVFRNGGEIANLELIDVAPTPMPQSPPHRVSLGGPSPSQQWSSPAVLKRVRLSDGPFFEAPYDPFAEDTELGHDKKRRRRSYRDWKAWTCSARTPSPEKDGAMEEDLGDELEQLSPKRAQQLPDTPVSPSRPEQLSVAAGLLERPAEEDQQHSTNSEELLSSETDANANVRLRPGHDHQYHELYAGPDEVPPEDSQYAFGGDTEIDTEVNTEEEDAAQDEPEGVSMTTTVANTEEEHTDNGLHRRWSNPSEPDVGSAADAVAPERISTAHILSDIAEAPRAPIPQNSDEDIITAIKETATLNTAPRITMPPPTLPILQMDDAAPVILDLLAPVGREPSSPKLKPLDSSTLPLPSPFPGDIDTNMVSYQDYFAANQDTTIPETGMNEEQELPSDADYIMETSFFSSIGSSKDPSLHPNHESAFTPVRFTFGMDGAGWSRPLDLSSPAPEGATVQETPQVDADDSLRVFRVDGEGAVAAQRHISISPTRDMADNESRHPYAIEDNKTSPTCSSQQAAPDVIELSSGSEAETSEESGTEDEMEGMAVEVGSEHSQENHDQHDDEHNDEGIQETGAVSAIVDLGSPADDTKDAELDISPIPMYINEVTPEADEFTRLTQQKSALESHQDVPSLSQDDDPQSKDPENYSEFVDLDYAPKPSHTAAETQQTTARIPPQQLLDRKPDAADADLSSSLAIAPRTALDGMDNHTQDAFDFEEAFHNSEPPMHDDELRYPDVKMESIEDDSIFESLTQLTREGHEGTPEGSPEELVIAVPEIGGRVGELHTVAVPATGPARNTRSKLSITVSPTRDRTHTPRRTTRSTRSNASVTRDTLSPVETRSRATFSTSQEPSQTSPYRLRSQSKLLSPVKISSETAPARTGRSSRTQASQSHETSQAERDHSLPDAILLDLGIFDPSYDPSASQGRFSNVTYVRDSEEDSVRSEHSLSTAYQTDAQAWLYSDPVQPSGSTKELEGLKLPPASAPEPKTRSRGKQANIHVARQAVRSSSPAHPTSPFSVQSIAGSPGRRLRSAGSANAPSEADSSVRQPSPVVSDNAVELEDPTTPKAVLHQAGAPLDENESTLAGVASDFHQQTDPYKLMRSSPPPVITTSFPTVNHHLATGKGTLITPDDTQQYTMESQPSINTFKRDDSSLITPEPTQATSFGLRSFDANKTAVNPSSDPSTDSTPPLPSIGLSTPLAYYTPLHSLSFFLNRSSQYHSSLNPDILALVTSDSTPPTRARRGPKHFFTTLHITDLATFPKQTTVNIFRPYESALPIAHTGDVILLRAFDVKSVKGEAGLRSAEESSWCVWRWGKPCWGAKRGALGEIRAREEVKGPEVERGPGEWAEVERIRWWFEGVVKGELEKEVEKGQGKAEESSQRVTRSQDRVGSQL
ncbi:hypothetical protein T440DRAFT_461676 [Plenodomus tracheiphilus IPT5]|uniref:Telomeric single stranded DNA binding POT1/Cdc13 domain-containing protein n=1 Tax=Plenodomus tracheiphilus IPT5 TaxID=1408161 RepID=A0A6A7ARC1_9PLEO|nr:hypothetical protein T440DRAFT_461676 [Plenodomus tracheiphilus IPT5]